MGLGFGWVKDHPDSRDHIYAPSPRLLKTLPPSVDLRPKMPPVYNQGNLNACTGNAIAAVIQFDEMDERFKKVRRPSRLFIYFNERAMEGTIKKDVGAELRDGFKSVMKQGDCPETMWPYAAKKFAERPPEKCYKRALQFRAAEYRRMKHNLPELKSCLASGHPFVFGFKVYSSFQGSAIMKSGVLKMPRPKEKTIGMHAVVCCGYDDSKRTFIVRNSWGKGWGMDGYFTMPYEYLLNENLAHDFWTFEIS